MTASSVHRGVRNLKHPPLQKRGLQEILSSYQLSKNKTDADTQEWALEWAKSGVLLQLVSIAAKLGNRVEAARMELVCLNSALIVFYLPEKTAHLNDMIQRLCHHISHSTRRGLMCICRLLAVLLRIESFKNEAMESNLMKTLHEQYVTRFLTPIHLQRHSNVGNRVEHESEAFSTSDEEIFDDLLDTASVSNGSRNPTVPKLNFTWLNHSTALDNFPRYCDRNYSIDRSVRSEGVTTISDRSTPAISYRVASSEARTDIGIGVERRSVRKLRKIFHERNRKLGRNSMHGLGWVLKILGLSETISLLGNMTDVCCNRHDFLSDLVAEWKLKSFLDEKEHHARYREKLAFLEVFLFMSPHVYESTPIKLSLTCTIVEDLRLSIKTANFQMNALRHCLAVYVELEISKFLKQQTVHDGNGILLALEEPKSGKDALLEMIIEEFNHLTALRRLSNPSNPFRHHFGLLDDKAFHKLKRLLCIASEYLTKSSFPGKIANNLIFSMSSGQRIFIRSAGQVLQWTESHVEAFRSFLSFYEAGFKKFKSPKEMTLLGRLVSQVMAKEWTRLLKEFAEGMLFENAFQWISSEERHSIIVETWNFFVALVQAVRQLNEQFGKQYCLGDFDFLLTPQIGLVSIVLEVDAIDPAIHQRVLRLLIEGCHLTRFLFIPETVVIESHMKSLVSHFIEQFIRPPFNIKKNISILALQLKAICTIMRCCPSSGLEHILLSSLPELLMNELHEATLRSASPARVHINEVFGHALKPSFLPMSKSISMPKFETVVSISFSSSSTESDYDFEDSELYPVQSLSESLTVPDVAPEALTFHDESQSLSDLTDEEMTNTPSNRLEAYPLLDYHPRCSGETTIEQIDNELFGSESEMSGTESDESEEWPSDLSVHGDIDEDGKRWEAYRARKKYRDGSINSEELQNRLAALETVPTSEENDEPGPNLGDQFCVPILNFERLISVPSDSTSGAISALAINPPFAESPSVSNPPNRSTDRAKERKDSTGSPAEMHPSLYHQRQSSLLPPSFNSVLTGRLVYDDDLRLTTIEFMIELLMLFDKYGDSISQDPTSLVGSITTIVSQDVNSEGFKRYIPDLLERVHNRGREATILLRLLLEDLFDVNQYITVDRIHKGEVTHVKRCIPKKYGKGIPDTCIVKVIDSSREVLRMDASILSVYSEISMMERVSGEPGFCQIYDFGVYSDSAYIVMQDCRCSLKDWIECFPISSDWAIRLALKIFKTIAINVQRLHQKTMVHFDLKCSNVLLKGEASNEGFWFPTTDQPEFEILLADFGVTRCYEGMDILGTVRNRGTEYAKAPEMLQITNIHKKNVSNYDRRRMKGVGPANDVWALGCLLFELLTNEMLHSDADWARFYTRVTQEGYPLFDTDKIKLLNETHRHTMLELLQFILVRDPERRPTIAAIIAKVDQLLESDVLPKYDPPRPYQILQIPSKKIDDHACSRLPCSEWFKDLIGDDKRFTLHLTKLRLSVTLLKGMLHASDASEYLDRLDTTKPMGVIFAGDLLSNKNNDFAKGLISRTKGICRRNRLESLFISVHALKEREVISEIKYSVEQWCRSSGNGGTVSLCTIQNCEQPFFNFLLDVIMSLEECPCLKAFSILKERVRGGSVSSFD